LLDTIKYIDMIEEYNKDYRWILKVLTSCKNQGQLDTTEKCYFQFRKKWNEFFKSTDNKIDELTFKCDEEFNIILTNKRNTLGW
jgi:hypothetical protein